MLNPKPTKLGLSNDFDLVDLNRNPKPKFSTPNPIPPNLGLGNDLDLVEVPVVAQNLRQPVLRVELIVYGFGLRGRGFGSGVWGLRFEAQGSE